MAITVIEEPNDIGLSKNPLVYKLESNNVYENEGENARYAWKFLDIPDNGDDFDLGWLDGGLEFTFSFTTGTPNNSGVQLPTIGGGVLMTYLDDILIPALKRNYYIHRDYNVFRLFTDTIIFEAKEVGAKYDLNFVSNPYAWDGGFTQALAGADKVKRPNFRVFLNLLWRFKGASTYNISMLEKLPIEESVVFDLGERLGDIKNFILPDIGSSSVLDISSSIIQYHISYAEAYGESLTAQRLTVLDGKIAIDGGFSEKDRFAINFNDDWLPNFLSQKGSCKVREAQPYFLSWLNKSTEITDFEFVAVVYVDGAAAHSHALYSVELTFGEMVTFPCSIAQCISGTGIAIGDVDKVLLYIQEDLGGPASIPITNVIELIVDRRPAVDEKYVGYKNAFGVYETAYFTGEWKQNINFSSVYFEPIEPYDVPAHERRVIKIGKAHSESVVLNTPYLNSKEIRDYLELLDSDNVYLIEGDTHIPMRMSSDSLTKDYSQSFKTNSFSVVGTFITEKNYSHAEDIDG